MTRQYFSAGALGLVLLLTVSAWGMGEDAGTGERPGSPVVFPPEAESDSGDRDVYTGTIRVYVTEKSSRWLDPDGRPFHNAFLTFALEEEISVNETDSLMWNLEWDGHDYADADGVPYDDIEAGNIEVIAAVFNSDGYTGYSDPPSGNEFTVHEVDACAAAACGTTGYNLAYDLFTHSVIVEDCATTW